MGSAIWNVAHTIQHECQTKQSVEQRRNTVVVVGVVGVVVGRVALKQVREKQASAGALRMG